jgi:hypothetical protein
LTSGDTWSEEPSGVSRALVHGGKFHAGKLREQLGQTQAKFPFHGAMDSQPEGSTVNLRRNIGQVPTHVKRVIGCEDPLSNTEKGVSSNGGGVRSRIISSFCRNSSVRSRWPPSKGLLMCPSAHIAQLQDAQDKAATPTHGVMVDVP